MLSAVLASQTAVDTSIRIMDAFVGMRRYLSSNAHIFQRLDHLEMPQLEAKFEKSGKNRETTVFSQQVAANTPRSPK